MNLATLIVIAAVTAANAKPLEIDQSFADSAFWESDPMLLMADYGKLGFAFTSGEKNAADCRRDGAVKCFGFGIYETVIRFGETKGIDQIELSFYNRGGVEKLETKEFDDGKKVSRLSRDDKTISRDEFMTICREISAKLTKSGIKPPKAVDGAMRTAEMFVKEKHWKKSAFGGEAKLMWSYTQKGKSVATFKPGYIKLCLSSPTGETSTKTVAKKDGKAKGATKIKDNVLKDSRGTFIDNLPMVDQGMKGYCAVATSERVLRYYGVEVDEHEIAQLAGTSADSGTSTQAMKESVEKIGKRYGLGIGQSIGDVDANTSERIANLNKEVENYNKAAKKLKAKPITDDMYIRVEGNTRYFDIAAVDKAMETKVLVEMKTKGPQASGYKKFLKSVHEQIDKGIPLFWSVKLGVAPEAEIPQTMGYHMRLIIGYDDKKNNIIYTDSWGAGHEFKKMRSDFAWTITKSLFYLKPLNK